MKLPKHIAQAIIKSMASIYLHFIIQHALASPLYSSIETELNLC